MCLVQSKLDTSVQSDYVVDITWTVCSKNQVVPIALSLELEVYFINI